MIYLKKLTILLSGAFILSVTYNKFHFQYDFENAFSRTFLSVLESTIWSNHFNEKKFSQIKIEMTKDEVIKILGLPLKEFCYPEFCLLTYSEQTDGVSSFDRRDIYLNQSSRVKKVVREFWID